MKTAELLLFREWLKAELDNRANPIYQNRARAEKTFQQLLKTCDDSKPK